MSQIVDECNDNFDILNNLISARNRFINFEDIPILVDKLRGDLKNAFENTSILQKTFNSTLENDKTDLNSKFLTIREYCSKLEIENVCLKEQVDELNVQLKIELEIQKTELKQNMEEWEKKSKYNMETLKSEIEKERISFRNKEMQLSNQLEAAYAETALRCDEIESSLKRQLVDVSNQLRQSQNVIRNQQMEIKNLKIQILTYEDRNKVPSEQDSNLLHFNESSNVSSNDLQTALPFKTSLSSNTSEIESLSSKRTTTKLSNQYFQKNDANTNRNLKNGVHSQWHRRPNSHDGSVHQATEISRTLNYSTNCSVAKRELLEDTTLQHMNDFLEVNEKLTNPRGNDINKRSVSEPFQGGIINQEQQVASRFLVPVNPTSNSNSKFDSMSPKQTPRRSCSQSENVEIKCLSNSSLGVLNGKYQSLPVSTKQVGKTITRSMTNNRINQIGKIPSPQRSHLNTPRCPLPPLMPCSNASSTKKKPEKKRKLYNPDDFEHLTHVNE